MRDWLLQELRGLKMVRMPKENAAQCPSGSKEDVTWKIKNHCKFKVSVREILNGWDALGVFVKNYQYPQQ
jgi:hypothetical protein